MRTISVMGVGRASCPADCAEISFVVRRADADCAKATEEVNSRAQALTEEFGKLFPKNALNTTSFDVSVEYANVTEEGVTVRKAIGFACRQSFRISVDYTQENLAAAIGVLQNKEAELSLRFTVRDPERLREKLLKDACKDAAAKAKTIARACGCKLGDIADIRYGTSDAFQPSVLRMNDRAVAAFASARAEIVPDEIKAEDSVTIVWQLD